MKAQFSNIAEQIKIWREKENLPVLDENELKDAARKYIKQKGLALPDKIRQGDIYFLVNGEYKIMKDSTISLQKQDPFSVVSSADDQEPKSTNGDWNYLYSGVLYCSKLGADVKFCNSPTLIPGTKTLVYYVKKIGDGTYGHSYPVLGQDLSLHNEDKRQRNTGRLEINLSSWAEIKNFLVQFVNSYTWEKQGNKSAIETREEILAKVKSPKEGIARLIEIEKNKYFFDGRDDFVARITDLYSSFPWSSFVDLVDFTKPMI